MMVNMIDFKSAEVEIHWLRYLSNAILSLVTF